MSAKDLFLNVLNHNDHNRTLKWEMGYWGGTLSRWYKEGLPVEFGFKRKLTYGEFVCGPGTHYPMPSLSDDILIAHDINSYFKLDRGPSPFSFNWFYYPQFEKIIIEETEEKVEYIGVDGIRKLSYKDERSMPLWLEHPVKSKSDWEQLVEDRLNLDNFSKRYTTKNINKYISEVKNRDYPLCLYGSPIGFFGILRTLIGEENLYYWYSDKPDLLKQILNYLCNFWISIAEELTSKVNFDYGRFYEDMAYKGGSLISPGIFKEFMAPNYKKLIDFARSKKVNHFIVDSDGYVKDLIPLFIEVGITGLLPFEVKAGNDIEKIREKHPDFIILGGIDKTVLTGKVSIDNELEKVKRMIKKGGYIPYGDHAIPPNISWNNYKYYRNKLNHIIETTETEVKKL